MNADLLRAVTVVVPVRDDLGGLRRCLGHLAAQDYPADLVQTLVVDNGSAVPLRPEQLSDVWPADTVLLQEPVPGSYRARNRCLPIATGSVLAFTDADCSPASDWLSAGVAALGATQALVAGDIAVYPAGVVPSPLEAYEMVRAFPQERYVREMGFGVTANLFVTADVVSGIGPFDETLTSGGDREFCTRAVRAGAQLGYCAQAVVRHPARATLSAVLEKARRVRRGRYDEWGVRPRPAQLLRRLVPPMGAFRRSAALGPDWGLRARYVVGEMLTHYAVAWVDLPYLWQRSRGGRA